MSESEIEALRRTVSELLAKRDKYKARIKELETSTTDLQTKLTASEKTVHDLTVGVPLRLLSESLSSVPSLFEEQLTRHYKVQLIDGKPALHTLEGKPVMTKDGKQLSFEQQPLKDFLTGEDNEHSKVFSTLIIGSRASGTIGAPTKSTPQQQQRKSQPSAVFGLR